MGTDGGTITVLVPDPVLPPRVCHGESPCGITACSISLAALFSPQAPCISDELCSRVYDFCTKLLTLPRPFCTIGLDYAARLKMERMAPGTMLPCSASEFGGFAYRAGLCLKLCLGLLREAGPALGLQDMFGWKSSPFLVLGGY